MKFWNSALKDMRDMPASTIKPLCVFLLNRYLGDFILERHLSIEQLSVDIFEGKGSLIEVDLNVNHINEMLGGSNAPFRLVDGFMRQVTLQIPWGRVLEESCDVEISGLELTVEVSAAPPAEAANSLLESVIDSMSASLALARSFVEEQHEKETPFSLQTDAERFEGLGTLAQFIDTLLFGMKVSLRDVVIRFERYLNDQGIAVEIRVEKFQFFDELFADEVQGSGAITVQPSCHRLCPTAQVSHKMMSISGVTLYTDHFSTSSTIRKISAMKMKHEAPCRSPVDSHGGSQESADETSIYQSCSDGTDPLTVSSLTKEIMNSEPVPFATFPADAITAKIQTRSSDAELSGVKEKLVDVDVFLGPLFVFLTPSQVHLLIELLKVLCDDSSSADAIRGEPMSPRDFDIVEKELKKNIEYGDRSPEWKADLRPGRWSGEDRFYAMASQANDVAANNFTSIPITGDKTEAEASDTVKQSSGQNVFRKLTPTTRDSSSAASESTSVHSKFVITQLWLTATYCDKLLNDKDGSELPLKEFVNQFFTKAAAVRLPNWVELKNVRQSCDRIVSFDHLRLLCFPVVFDIRAFPGNFETRYSLEVSVVSRSCEFVELLFSKTHDNSGEADDAEAVSAECTPLLTFPSEGRESSENHSIVIKFSHTTKGKNAFIQFCPCHSEIDITMIDRIQNLLSPEFMFNKLSPYLGLKEDLFELYEDVRETPGSVQLSLKCPSWTFNVRFPVLDLRPGANIAWWTKMTRPESLVLTVDQLRLTGNVTSNAKVKGCVSVKFSSAIGSLQEGNGQCSKLFCCSRPSDSKRPCSAFVQWDFLKSRLSKQDLPMAESSAGAQTGGNSFFDIRSAFNGPFSNEKMAYEEEQLTVAGNAEELDEFRESSTRQAEINISICVDRTRLMMPDKRLCEVLYNRLLNDLVLWRCSNPLLRTGDVFSCANSPGNTTNSSSNFKLMLHKTAASDSDLDEFASVNAPSSALINEVTSAYRASVLFRSTGMQTVLALADEDTAEPLSVLELTSDMAEMFVVVGIREKHRNTSTDYFYFTADNLSVVHRNFFRNIRKDSDSYISNEQFSFTGSNTEAQVSVIAGATPKQLQLHKKSGNCLTVSCRLTTDSADQTKKSLIAISTHDMMFSYVKVSLFRLWIDQLTHLFSPALYPIPGYVVPLTVTELHLHFTNMALEYRPKLSNYIVYVFVESLDISTNFLKEASLFRLRFIVQDSSVFLGEVEAVCPQASRTQPSINDLVCLMRMGLCEFLLSYQESCDQFSEERVPRLDLVSRNDVLHLYTCADSFCALTTIIAELCESSSSPRFQQPVQEKRVILTKEDDYRTCEEQKSVKTMLHDAIGDGSFVSQSNAPTGTKSATRRRSGLAEESSARDDVFVMLENVPGTGIIPRIGQPAVRVLSDSDVVIIEDHFKAPLSRTDHLTAIPEGFPSPLVQYLFKDISFVWHFYGGRDLGTYKMAKLYSAVGHQSSSIRIARRISEGRKNVYTSGGKCRDHTVSVDLCLSKVSFVHEVYPPGNREIARQILSVYDAEIHDKLALSKVEKFLSASQNPQQTFTPLVSVKCLFVSSENTAGDSECCLKVSILPVHLNVDQDTLEFLQDFARDCAFLGKSEPLSGYAKPESSNKPQNSSRTSKPDLIDLESDDFYSNNLVVPENGAPPFEFSAGSPSSQEAYEERMSSDQQGADDSFARAFSENFASTSPDGVLGIKGGSVGAGEDEIVEDNFRCVSRPVYFRHFSLSPAIELTVEYQGKRINVEHGALQGLLLGLSQLHCTKLMLKNIDHQNGVLGFEKLVNFVLTEWANDVRKNQLLNIVGEVGIMHHFSQIVQGIKDLFWIPVYQYRTDGHIIKGVQRGARSFGVSTVVAVLELSQKFVSAIQEFSEVAFEIVNPEYPSGQRHDIFQPVPKPADFREGLSMACSTVKTGFSETAQAIAIATQEERARGRWMIRGLLRQATPTIIRPIVFASHATAQMLGGLCSQLKTEAR